MRPELANSMTKEGGFGDNRSLLFAVRESPENRITTLNISPSICDDNSVACEDRLVRTKNLPTALFDARLFVRT